MLSFLRYHLSYLLFFGIGWGMLSASPQAPLWGLVPVAILFGGSPLFLAAWVHFRAGPVLARNTTWTGDSSPDCWFALGLPPFLIAAIALVLLIGKNAAPDNIVGAAFLLAFAALACYWATQFFEVRERGVYLPGRPGFVPWSEIASYRWTEDNRVWLELQVSSADGRTREVRRRVLPGSRERIEEALAGRFTTAAED